MMLIAKNLSNPDHRHTFTHGEIEEVTLGGVTMARAVFQPGWRWSADVSPLVGTKSCEHTHSAIVVSGRLHVKMDDGTERDLGPGDAHVVGPSHDAWVVGDEPCVALDFSGAPTTGALRAECPCGVSFRVDSEAALDHLVAAVQEHARGSHDLDASREHVLSELQRD